MQEFMPADRRSIEARGLTLSRGGRRLFAGLSFSAAPGEVVLLRGPNGAGKSSLLLTLCGHLRPEAGTIAVAGRAVDAQRSPADIHFVGHAAAVKPQLSLAQNLLFWADVLGGSAATVPAALTETGLGGLDNLPAGYLSAGQTRRLALARLLVVRRPIWLLDEPVAALDAQGVGLVLRLIDAHAAAGGLVIAATHDDLPLGAPVRALTLEARA